MRDGVELRGNVYRPASGEPAPVIMTFGPYGKDTPLARRLPKYFRAAGGGLFLNHETPDPEHWVPRGYAILRVDSRGSWESPGKMDPISEQQAQDYYDAIEWAGTQPWSTGKVGLLGISYYAFSQWSAAALQPPHLAALIPWEGAADAYRDFLRHGGIIGSMSKGWGSNQVRTAHPGSETVDVYERALEHPLDDGSYGFSPDLSRITAPLLSVGNWGNTVFHLRGNTEGYVNAASEHRYLRLITGGHFLPFYRPDNMAMQEDFFNRFLKDDPTAWTDQPRVRVAVRDPQGERTLDAEDWPIPGTQWTDYALDTAKGSLLTEQPTEDATAALPAPDGVVSFTLPVTERTEILGPVALRVWVSSTTVDADIYIRVRQILASGEEFFGIDASEQPVQLPALGWLRASHRALDEAKSEPYRPYHPHTERDLLTPGVPVPLDIEIWPTSIVLSPGDTLILEVAAKDDPGTYFGFGDGPVNYLKMGDSPVDRKPEEFDGTYTVHTGPSYPGYLRLPILPSE
jgi:predicted acyl esterase